MRTADGHVKAAGNRACRDLSNDKVAWGKLEDGPKEELPMDMTRAEYLAALLPG